MDRDQAILHAVFEHRLLTCEHLHRLFFVGAGRRVSQARLRRLWAAGFLERRFVPLLRSTNLTDHAAPMPLYALAPRGLRAMRRRPDRVSAAVRIPPAPSFDRLAHDLVVADLFAAAAGAVHDRVDIELVSLQSEGALRRSLAAWQRASGRSARAALILPDGALSLRLPGRIVHNFCVEIVRAGASGGNRSVASKLARYAALHRDGFFRGAYGHVALRAVLVATTSRARAERFRALAGRLPHARRLFWFGSFEQTTVGGVPVSSFDPQTIALPVWRDADGAAHALVPAPSSTSL